MKINFNNYGLFRVAASSPELRLADIDFNIQNIKKDINKAVEKGAKLILFPELCISGYTMGDLFFQKSLINKSYKAIGELIEYTKNLDIITVVGNMLVVDNQMFNCAFCLYKGKILGIVPKTHIPNYNEFYEKRWFETSTNKINNKVDFLNYRDIPFDTNFLIEDKKSGAVIALEVCEDLWVPIPPSSYHSLYGANIILNLSASNELLGKEEYRKSLVEQQSARLVSAYLYASSSRLESTSDLVFSNHLLIAENGKILDENSFDIHKKSHLIISDIDVERLISERIKRNSFMENVPKLEYQKIIINMEEKEYEELLRKDIKAGVFITDNQAHIKKIIDIQTAGLMRRIEYIGTKHMVVGISGGLDSTLALLVAVNTFKALNLPLENIIAITMPGFGTTGRTYQNAVTMIKGLGASFKEISIKEASIQHFKDINHDPEKYDVVYENVQARERTQILMDVANQYNTIVLGTGNLSEIALGWCTYNADHMSMYAVNGSIPKTLVKSIIAWIKDNADFISLEVKNSLNDILDTPISPELLPLSSDGEILQKTESVIGDYILHDFFLFYMVRHNFSPSKILLFAKIAFKDMYSDEDIKKYLKIFIKRFFNNQFKRNCMPDTVKVGSVSLSPRGDWRMPSEAIYRLWLDELDD